MPRVGWAASGWLQTLAQLARMSTIGQEQSVVAGESGRSTFDISCITRLAGHVSSMEGAGGCA